MSKAKKKQRAASTRRATPRPARRRKPAVKAAATKKRTPAKAARATTARKTRPASKVTKAPANKVKARPKKIKPAAAQGTPKQPARPSRVVAALSRPAAAGAAISAAPTAARPVPAPRAIFFRCDGAEAIGYGHLMRCLAMADYLQDMGLGACAFICRDHPEVGKLVASYGFPVHLFNPEADGKRDVASTVSAVRSTTPLGAHPVVITDSYELNRAYHAALAEAAECVIALDDFNTNGAFPGDVIINPNYGAEELKYRMVKPDALKLLGCRYFILRREFREVVRTPRIIVAQTKRLLITMGGSDLSSLTLKVLQAASHIESLEVKVVIGPTSPLKDLIWKPIRKGQPAVPELFSHFELLTNPPNMADLMLWADLAVAGGGLTKYELAVTGTPAILLAQVPHQHDLAKAFAREGSAMYLGLGNQVPEHEIKAVIDSLLEAQDVRRIMSERGRALVDGRGLDRLVDALGWTEA